MNIWVIGLFFLASLAVVGVLIVNLVGAERDFQEKNRRLEEMEAKLKAAPDHGAEALIPDQQAAESSQELSALREENSRLRGQLEPLQRERARDDKASRELAEMKHRLPEAERELTSLRESNSRLQARLEDLQQEHAERQRAMEELRHLRAQVEQIQHARGDSETSSTQPQDTPEQRSDAEKLILSMREENARLFAQISALRKERDASQEVVRSLEVLQERVPELEQQIINLRGENLSLSNQGSDLRKQHHVARENIARLEQTLEEQRANHAKQTADFRTENTKLLSQMALLTEQGEAQQRRIQSLEGLQQRLNDAGSEISQLREQNSHLQGQIAQMKASIAEKLESQLAGLKELQHQVANSAELKGD